MLTMLRYCAETCHHGILTAKFWQNFREYPPHPRHGHLWMDGPTKPTANMCKEFRILIGPIWPSLTVESIGFAISIRPTWYSLIRISKVTSHGTIYSPIHRKYEPSLFTYIQPITSGLRNIAMQNGQWNGHKNKGEAIMSRYCMDIFPEAGQIWLRILRNGLPTRRAAGYRDFVRLAADQQFCYWTPTWHNRKWYFPRDT